MSDEGAPTRTHRMFDAWNTHDVEQVLTMYTPDFYFVDPTTNEPVIGHEGLRHYAEVMFHTFPDATFTVTEVVVDGGKEVANWLFTGTQLGSFMHRPATGRAVQFRGIDWVEFDGDLVRRNITYYDTGLILERLGLS